MTISHLQPVEGPVLTMFDAEMLCRAWLTVSIAAIDEGDDSGQMIVERYEEGLRLVATDGHMLLTAFVPHEASANMPGFDEMPIEAFVVSDSESRGSGLLKFALRQVKPSGAPEQTVGITLGTLPAKPGQFATMSSRAISFEFPAGELVSETVTLEVVERDPYNWRLALATVGDPEGTEAIQLGPSLGFGRLAKIGTHWPAASIRLEFTGPSQAYRIVVPSDFHGITVLGVGIPQNIEERGV